MTTTSATRQHRHVHSLHASQRPASRSSMLSWPAWKRVAAVLPLCLLLWLGVAWALAENLA